jgi:hypothetical protein
MMEHLVFAICHVWLELTRTDNAWSHNSTILFSFNWAFTWTTLGRIFLIIICSVCIFIYKIIVSCAKRSFRRFWNNIFSFDFLWIDLPARFLLMTRSICTIIQSRNSSEWTYNFLHALVRAIAYFFLNLLSVNFVAFEYCQRQFEVGGHIVFNNALLSDFLFSFLD